MSVPQQSSHVLTAPDPDLPEFADLPDLAGMVCPIGVLAVLVGFMDEARKARSLADVNVAAGMCLEELVATSKGPDQLGELVHLPLEPT